MPERFASGLEDNAANNMVELLNQNLYRIIDLSLSVKQAHWNLKGPGFIAVHELLDEVYGRLQGIGDEMAERAVILGGIARGTTQIVADKSDLPAYPVDETDIDAHLKALGERFKIVGAELRKAIDKASEAGDEDTTDLFTGASRSVDKDAWFIGANLKS